MAILRGRDTQTLSCSEWPKKFLLKSGHPTKYLPNFTTQKNLESKISNPVPVTWNPEYTPPPAPPGDSKGWFRAVQGVKTTLKSHRGKPVVVSRLNKSFLLMSKNACFSCWMFRFGCAVSRYSKSRIVGLKSAYCSKRLITFTSTFSSLEKCFQLGISLISLSRNSAICSIRSGFIVKTSDNKDPFKNKKMQLWLIGKKLYNLGEI